MLRSILISILIISGVFLPSNYGLHALMTSTNFRIESDVLSAGGVTQATSTNFRAGTTVGEFFAFTATSTNRQSRGGFWQMGNEGLLGLSLSPANIGFGDLSISEVRQVNQTVTVTSTVTGGYTLTVRENGNLRTSAGDDIDDVTDGSVTATMEEYGFSTSGSDGQFNSTDTNFTTAAKTIAVSSTPAHSVTTTIIYKAAVSQGTTAGSYSHALTLQLSAVF
jgi:hypothetical protein